MPTGLTVAGHGDFAQVRRCELPQRCQGNVDQFNRLRVGEVVSRITRVEGGWIGMPEKVIGRQHGISMARAAHRLVARVPHQAVALVHQDHGWEASIASRMREDRRHSVVANHVLHRDTAYGAHFGSPCRAEPGKAAEEREFREKLTPWGEGHCCPPAPFA
jgi:hypothetical protein